MTTTAGDRTWLPPVLRAVPAALAAIVIAFSANHSPTLGFVALGVWAAATALIIGIPSLRGQLPRAPFAAQAIVLLGGGLAAFALFDRPVAVLLFLTSTLFGASGGIELVTGIVLRTTRGARDWIFVGALGALLALAALALPADFSQAISIPEHDVPALTASTIIVGLFGAYCAIVAVYLVIAGLSLKWAVDPAAPATEQQ